MSTEPLGTPRSLSAVDAGRVLGLPADVVRALADAGYLRPSSLRGVVPRFALGDLKAFQARTQGMWPGTEAAGVVGAGDLLAALDERAAAMARHVLELVGEVLPEVHDLTARQRDEFLADVTGRIEAILTVCIRGSDHDGTLEGDLAAVGRDAARRAVPLPVLLLTLRTSRDLVVQTAVDVAERRGGEWALALSAALMRVVPAVDRLADAVAAGYWTELLTEARER